MAKSRGGGVIWRSLVARGDEEEEEEVEEEDRGTGRRS